MIEHVVEQGECVASIAAAYGAPAKKVWNAPENELLREQRTSPNVLLPGDSVFVNDQDRKEEPCATEQRHRFRKHAEKAWLRIKLLDLGEARAGEKFVLKVGDDVIQGTTDQDGKIEVAIPPTAMEAVLRLGNKERGEDYILKIGSLDPVSEPSGLQARLANLGYDAGDSQGMDAATRRAVREFQHDRGLKVGELNDQTREKLQEEYGS